MKIRTAKKRVSKNLTSGDVRHVVDQFAMASLRNGMLCALVVHTSSSICFPLHSLDSPIDLLKMSIKIKLLERTGHEGVSNYLRNSAVTTFHSQWPHQLGTMPVPDSATATADCDDDFRTGCFYRAARANKSGLIMDSVIEFGRIQGLSPQ